MHYNGFDFERAYFVQQTYHLDMNEDFTKEYFWLKNSNLNSQGPYIFQLNVILACALFSIS